jgi:hypothetical protein
MLKQFADRQFVVEHGLGAEQQQGGARQLVDILDGVLALGAQHGRLKGRADVGGETLLPLRRRDRLDSGGLDRLYADDGFDEELLAFGAAVEFLVEPLAQQRPRHPAIRR